MALQALGKAGEVAAVQVAHHLAQVGGQKPQVQRQLAGAGESLGIPTWLYGHEPPNPFASHLAKYFANSVREEGLITLARGGIVFAPGAAGTIQEIFQDAAQNRYAVTGEVSAMVFLGVDFWRRQKPVYPLLSQLAEGFQYAGFLTVVDDAEIAAEFLRTHPPQPADTAPWSYCDDLCGED